MQQLSFDDLLLPRAERAGRSRRQDALFDQVTDFGNLYAAYREAARGKHDRAAVLRHDLHAEKILWRLRWQLRAGRYRHGGYYRFRVFDPKPRDVAAAHFTDRVVHHAVVRVIEPLFERGFISDSYACRRGKGSHQAALRLQHFLRSLHDRHGAEFYVLRTDIRKFFASIDHAVLASRLARRVRDGRVREVLEGIIDSYHEPNPQRGGGVLANSRPPAYPSAI
ncbi:MAG TPA: hypothetical protein VHC21_02335 [Candidatus Saccharimonadales bacterium]|nr:hypothetical protein [Candidatus Saccharimonadales bacterium]